MASSPTRSPTPSRPPGNSTPAPAPAPSKKKHKPDLDPYYTAVSGKFKIAKYISVLALIVFLIFSFTFLRNDITLENLRYLLKFISFTNTETSISAAKINYASGDPNRLELFMGDLCTLTPSGYALYDSRGNQIMAENTNYNSPVLKVSSGFALCYDLGGNVFTVINTFTKLHDDMTEYPITDGTVADNGSFAIGSSSRDYHTSVTVYDSDFKPDIRILRNDRLTALEFKSDGSELAIMTAGAENGSFYSVVELIEPGKAEPRAKVRIGSLGYSLYYTDRGLAAVTDEGIVFMSQALETVKTVKHPSSPVMSYCSGPYTVCMYSNGVISNTYTATVYDSSGNELYTGTFSGKPVDIDSDRSGEYIFIHTGTTVSRLNMVDKKLGSIEVAPEATELLCDSPDTVLAAFKNYALTYSLSDITEHFFRTQSVDAVPEAPETSSDTSADTSQETN